MNVGVVGNPRYSDVRGLLARLAQGAQRHRFTLFSEPDLADLWPQPVARLADGERLDLLITFGGDGTLLRGARLLGERDAPILGVNLGRMGFLTTATPDTMDEALEAAASGRYEVDTRCALEGRIRGSDGAERPGPLALNDVVLHKGGVARVIGLRVLLKGEEIGRYSADGIIVATPTGSTAYSLSAGGPVVLPGVDALVITPICPHTLAVRPIVVPGDSEVAIEQVPPLGDEVLVSYDGQVGTVLKPNERVLVHRARAAVRLIRLEKEGFFARMRRKLQWGELSDRDRG